VDHAFRGQIAILVGVWATFALDVYSTLNSSPQTTELFASDRASSLWFWVVVGGGVGIAGGAIATFISGTWWPLAATVFVTAMMWFFYKLALRRGGGERASDRQLAVAA
jgi:amino acid permease